MLTDKEVKKEFKKKASKDPDKYYATSVLKKEGFTRAQCTQCKTFFWSTIKSRTCGDPACSGGFRFIDKPPAQNKLSYIEVWETFSKMFKKAGYTPIKRYPVVARWREDTDFVQASIYDFQPYVVSGEVKPPANPLVVPQFCLRFNDIDNVGITGAHYTGFVMIGQHAFVQPKEWDQAKYFTDIHHWLTKGLGLPAKEIIYHEDAWAGGGNFGPCMEFFSRGLELGNQVYMLYEKTPSGSKELALKVLDMGMGHERNAWFTLGKTTSYETTFPEVMHKLRKATAVKEHTQLMKQFLPYASYLNVDEVSNIDKAWASVARKMSMGKKELKESIQETAALYSVAEHTRALLIALSDGGLPSNVGGGYNLRLILRRALSFIDRYQWNIDLCEIAQWHASYLKPLFPEVSKNLNEVHDIFKVEKEKYHTGRQRARQIIQTEIKKTISEKKLFELYDSKGISPELIREEALRIGKDISIPDNFYAKVSELHEKKQDSFATTRTEKIALDAVPATSARYFEDWKKTDFTAKVVKQHGNYLILNETYFYPTSGGQLHDTGTIAGESVVDVFKQGHVIIHVLSGKKTFIPGQEVACHIDGERRMQLAQHHTTAHIINAAARIILGNHINQASAHKDIDKGRIDITHYKSLTDEEVRKIEMEANRIVEKHIQLKKGFVERTAAEQQHGMTIYQGGVVPGKELRIVEIPGIDVEACGGTHLDNTSQAGVIKIIKATKISDSIVRLEYKSGKAAERAEAKESSLLQEIADLLHVQKDMVPARAEEVFTLWKEKVKKKKQIPIQFTSMTPTSGTDDELLRKTATLLKTQPEHVKNTLTRFLHELDQTT